MQPTQPTTRAPRVLARDLASVEPGERATLAGWIHRRRVLASVTFLVLRDRSGLAQVVVKDRETVEQLAGLPEETVVEVTGTVSANESAPGGAELVEPVVTALTEPAVAPPDRAVAPDLRRRAADAPRPRGGDPAPPAPPGGLAARERVDARLPRGARQLSSSPRSRRPKLVGTATESGANVFTVDYFGRTAYLAQSPQLYKQMLVGVFERVFEVGPVFRAEPHDTVRHLAQYTSLDAELGFIRDHHDVLAVLREAIAGMVEGIREYAADAAALLGVELPQVPEQFPVIHFSDALAKVGADPDEPDLSPAHERALSEWAKAAYGSDFLAVEGYPMGKRPFYTHPQPGDERWSNSFDLLFRGLELTTGGQRLHRPSDYAAALERTGTDPAVLAGYLDAFAHGMPPHGGFAIGLERWVGRLTGAENIREVTLFPRDLHRLEP